METENFNEQEFSEEYIQARLYFEYQLQYTACFDNIYLLGDGREYEMDFCMFLPNRKGDMCYEFEIKKTNKDFQREKEKVTKHTNYSKGINCPNYFYYICPPGVISVEDLPNHAGLMEVREKKIRTLKRAPLLTEDLIDPMDAYRKAYNKYFEWKRQEFDEIISHGPAPRKRRSTYGKKRRARKKPTRRREKKINEY